MNLCNKRKIFILFALFSVCFSVYAQTEVSESNFWYIAKCRDKKVLEKDIKGPFYSREQTIAVWIFSETPENKNFCIAKNYTFVTKKPSTYYRRLYAEIKGEIDRDLETATYKYNLNNDPARAEEMLLELQENTKKDIEQTSDKVVSDTTEEKTVQNDVTSENTEIVIQDTPENLETIETLNKEVNVSEHQEENQAAENLNVEKKDAEVVNSEEVIPEKKSDGIPFSLDLDNKATIRRYRKEYLQDYIPAESYNPEEKVTVNNTKIENPDEIDSEGRTLLMIAAKTGNDWQIKNLIQSNANINLQDKDGWTALMYAVRYQESVTVVKELLNAKADVKITNKFEYSALVLAACYNNNPEILNLLLDYYSISEKEVLKAFTLMISSKQISEYSEIAKLNVFLQRSIPLNSFYNGKTPLMYAAQFGNSTKIIKLLLENEALTGLRSTDGKTAFDYASNNKNLVHDENYWALNKK